MTTKQRTDKALSDLRYTKSHIEAARKAIHETLLDCILLHEPTATNKLTHARSDTELILAHLLHTEQALETRLNEENE